MNLVVQLLSSSNSLLRVLNYTFAIAVTVGGTIGVGILRAPALVAVQFHNAKFIVGMWLVGGLYVLFASFSVAELAAMLPQAGGFYVYSRRAFGNAAGFISGWVDWLTQCANLAFLAVSMAEFSGMLWPYTAGGMKEVGSGLILVFILLHWLGIRVTGRTQELACALQTSAFTALIIASFAFTGPRPDQVSPTLVSTVKSAPAFWIPAMLALRLVVGTYDGWYSAIYFGEEVKDPTRALPTSIIGGVATVSVIYTLVNAALLHLLPVSTLAGSKLPAAVAATIMVGVVGGTVITALALVSLPAVLNATLLCATRIAFAMSRDGLFWRAAVTVDDRGTPVTALALSALAGLAFTITGTFERLLSLVAVLNLATYCAAFIAVLVLRRREPGLPRPFRIRPYPALTLVALSVACALLIGAAVGDPRSSVWAFGLVAVGYPLYHVTRRS
jgi:basic amino acid/polyamine antiporter, APA family